ncbi:type IV pilus assembly protein PilM [Candidatus Falkowbacteria bacterium]|nr:type IV pilus assembly protein PilM [Candidatus Falkowbacteria bacterium]
MFGFFKQTKGQGFLGVDIGGACVKMVELSVGAGHPKLETYGYLERAMGEKVGSLLDEPQRLAEVLKEVAQKAGVKTKKAISALPSNAVFSTIINLPNISKDELASPKKLSAAVEWEAKKVVPLALNEMILDWKVLENVAAAKDDKVVKSAQVLLTGAAKKVVQKYLDAFQRAGMELISLETESFALTRALLGNDKSVAMIVDLGANDTTVVIVENSIPYIERSVTHGGTQLSAIMAKTMGTDVGAAEQFKRDLGAHLAGNRNAEMQMPKPFKDFLEPIVNEMRYVINFFLEQPGNQNKRIERIILSGGSANLLNLGKHLETIFNIRAFVGNPWARIIYPEEMQPILDEIGPRFAPAIGLALRNF